MAPQAKKKKQKVSLPEKMQDRYSCQYALNFFKEGLIDFGIMEHGSRHWIYLFEKNPYFLGFFVSNIYCFVNFDTIFSLNPLPNSRSSRATTIRVSMW